MEENLDLNWFNSENKHINGNDQIEVHTTIKVLAKSIHVQINDAKMFTVVLFAIDKIWNPAKCPLKDEQESEIV